MLSIEEQRAEWMKEQVRVAALVEVLPDSPIFDHEHASFTCRTREDIPHDFLYGGVDVSFGKNETAVAVYCILNSNLDVVYSAHENFTLTTPYIPSFLAFREIEPLCNLVRDQIKCKPDLTPKVILVDGNGVLHCRRAGLACFLGIRTGVPTIGIGKTLYCEGGLTVASVETRISSSLYAATQYIETQHNTSSNPIEKNTFMIYDNQSNTFDSSTRATEVLPTHCHSELSKHGSFGLAVPLMVDDRKLAYALINHGGRIGRGGSGTVNPIYVSVGHKTSLYESVYCAATLSLSRIPEPVRQADLIGRDMLRKKWKECHERSQTEISYPVPPP